MVKMSITENTSTYNIEHIHVFEVTEMSETHSENCIWSILPMQMLVHVHLDMFDTGCRPCPNFKATGPASDEHLAKNRLQIRNLRALKYREQCTRSLVVCFVIMKKVEKPCPCHKWPAPPPDSTLRVGPPCMPEESASHHEVVRRLRPLGLINTYKLHIQCQKPLACYNSLFGQYRPWCWQSLKSQPLKPEENASHHGSWARHVWRPSLPPTASLQSRDVCKALSNACCSIVSKMSFS